MQQRNIHEFINNPPSHPPLHHRSIHPVLYSSTPLPKLVLLVAVRVLPPPFRLDRVQLPDSPTRVEAADCSGLVVALGALRRLSCELLNYSGVSRQVRAQRGTIGGRGDDFEPLAISQALVELEFAFYVACRSELHPSVWAFTTRQLGLSRFVGF